VASAGGSKSDARPDMRGTKEIAEYTSAGE